MVKNTVCLYVEGGGRLETACRKAFTTFITKAGIVNRPRIVACGSRANAHDCFCTAVESGRNSMLLVDSEQPINDQYQQGQQNTWQPWGHLQAVDRWQKPARSVDSDCHLMVQVMESWFLTDRATLRTFFGQGFLDGALPAATRSIESVAKTEIFAALKKATQHCKTKAVYDKGADSFRLLERVDPTKIKCASQWAQRFIDALRTKMETSAWQSTR